MLNVSKRVIVKLLKIFCELYTVIHRTCTLSEAPSIESFSNLGLNLKAILSSINAKLMRLKELASKNEIGDPTAERMNI